MDDDCWIYKRVDQLGTTAENVLTQIDSTKDYADLSREEKGCVEVWEWCEQSIKALKGELS